MMRGRRCQSICVLVDIEGAKQVFKVLTIVKTNMQQESNEHDRIHLHHLGTCLVKSAYS